MNRNTDGVTRTVYLIGPHAIKVPTMRYGWRFFLRGLLSNMNESDVWGWSAAEGWAERGIPRALIARVRWCCPGGFLLCMERADRTLREDELESVPAEMHRVRDLKADNVGVFGRELRIIDYGEGWTSVEQEHERRGAVGIPAKGAP